MPTILVTEATFVSGRGVSPGDILELDEVDAALLLMNKRGNLLKKPKEESKPVEQSTESPVGVTDRAIQEQQVVKRRGRPPKAS